MKRTFFRLLALGLLLGVGIGSGEALAAPLLDGGSGFTLGLRSNGTLWAAGRNSSGQLGDGTTIERLSPVYVASNIASVSAGAGHALALTHDGTVLSWGTNTAWALGRNDVPYTSYSATPGPVPGLSNIVAVAAGNIFSMALDSDGRVWTWGYNLMGQLGDGTTTMMRLTPTQVPSLSGIVAISAGESYALALKDDGTIWAWGNNRSGQLGDPSAGSQSRTPVQVQTIDNAQAIVAGYEHALAIRSDGTLWAWGRNGWGQLGDGTVINRSQPVPVPGLDQVTSIAAGSGHSLAVRNGDVYTWGRNANGQLGNGTTIDSHTPAPLSDISTAAEVASGLHHSLVRRTDNTVWVWGQGVGLGANTAYDQLSPVFGLW